MHCWLLVWFDNTAVCTVCKMCAVVFCLIAAAVVRRHWSTR